MSVMIPVGIVTLCVLLYAVTYMSHDPNRNRFLIILTAMKAALSAVLLNRMGDTFLVVALGLLINYYNAVDYETIILLSPYMNTLLLNILSLLFSLAATAKSAQLGLHG
ncbi:NAD5 NADH-ubiquinone oxidoreductase chain 5 [Candida maltosa Xu316]